MLNLSPPTFLSLSPRLAGDAYRGISFTPEKRAASLVEGFASELAADWQRLASRCETQGDVDRLRAEFDRYQRGYLSKYQAWLVSKSRCMSWMIAGPSKFPVRRMEKRNRSEHNRLEELIAFRKRALHAIR